MAFHPYLYFSGDCRSAMTRYQEVFGGELVLLPFSQVPASEEPVPAEHADLIMHAALSFGDSLLMASDDPSGDGGPKTGVSIHYSTKDGAEAEKVFAGLADGGQVSMPLAPTFWSPAYGMCVDRFGVPWQVSVEAAEGPS